MEIPPIQNEGTVASRSVFGTVGNVVREVGTTLALGAAEGAAIFSGVEGPVAAIRKSRERAFLRGVNRRKSISEVLTKTTTLFKAAMEVPKGKIRDRFVEANARLLDELVPGGGAGLRAAVLSGSDAPEQGFLRALVEESELVGGLFASKGEAETLVYLAEHPQLFKAEYLPIARKEVREKLPKITDFLRRTNPELLKKIETDGIKLSEFTSLNETELPREYRLSHATVKVLSEQTGFLAELGIISDALADTLVEEGAKVKAGTPRNVAIPGVGIRITTNGKTVMIDGEEVAIPEGSRIFGVSAQGTVGEVTGLVGAPTEEEREESAAAARESAADIAQATSLLRGLDRVGPGGVGIRANTVIELGGVLQQLDDALGTSIGGQITRAIAGGVEPAEVVRFRAQAKAFVANSVPDVTGEEGKRITDRELAIAGQIARIDTATASLSQVRAAIESAIILRYLRATRQGQIGGVEPEHDIATHEGRLAIAEQLGGFGLPVAQVSETLQALTEQRELIEQFTPGGSAGVPEGDQTQLYLDDPGKSFPGTQGRVQNLAGQPPGTESSEVKITVEMDGRTWVLPTLVFDEGPEGQVLSTDEAVERAKKIGLEKFPSFDSEAIANIWMERRKRIVGRRRRDAAGQ